MMKLSNIYEFTSSPSNWKTIVSFIVNEIYIVKLYTAWFHYSRTLVIAWFFMLYWVLNSNFAIYAHSLSKTWVHVSTFDHFYIKCVLCMIYVCYESLLSRPLIKCGSRPAKSMLLFFILDTVFSWPTATLYLSQMPSGLLYIYKYVFKTMAEKRCYNNYSIYIYIYI